MERKERILEYMKSDGYIPLTMEELGAVLAVPETEFEEFVGLLAALVAEGRVQKSKNKRFTARNTVRGRLRCNARGRFGFVETDGDEEDIFIGRDDFGDAIDGDIVDCEVLKRQDSHHTREGRIIAVAERGNVNITGVITKKTDDVFYIKPDNDGIFARVTAPESELCQKGDRVVLKIEEYKKGDIFGRVTVNLGRADELKSCVEATIIRHGIKTEFDAATLAEVEGVPGSVTDISGRRDLRNELIFTIDGDDARDFDDAVSLEMLPNGNYRLGVHIADVTHYVNENSALDNEAFLRGTSVYLPDRVIPMLPVELSNGICSLNPNVDRYTLSVVMELDSSGGVVSHELFKAVINSSHRLTYNIVADMLEGDERLRKKYSTVYPVLTRMQKLAAILNKKREERGSINFDFPEAKVVVDKGGEPIDIIKEERRISHKMIEEFMLVANETVAEYAFWAELPFIYRVHEPPEAEKIEAFSRFIHNFGLGFRGRVDKEEGIHPKAMQAVLEKIKGSPEEEMISKYMLRSLMKAAYKPENLGHFGLAAKYYCHFTSPIRRYPDLMIHRILKAFLDGKSLAEFGGVVDAAAENSSKTERTAELCERDVDDIMKARFMSGFLGECFEGKVSGVTKFGIFVELENTVEGLLRLENMHDDYYEYDEERRVVRGSRKRKEYKIGDDLDVMVVRCDVMSGSIDFLTADADFKDVNKFHEKRKKERKTEARHRAKKVQRRRGFTKKHEKRRTR